ncbi:MAG TPA: DUF6529 family protein [Actinomycetes bacterium]|nr:DUF6529 family protein [Actinomycetes bacterium]
MPETNRASLALIGALVVGAVVSVSLGAYGRVHDPTFESITTLGFSTLPQMKAWLATLAAVLALVQLITALRMYGRLGSGKPSRAVAITHRTSGVVAVLVTLPVAYHCLWSLGFETYSNRVLVHSVLGCLFYGVFVAKMLTLKIKRAPGWAIPLLGGATFAVLIGVVSTSAFWYFAQGSPSY